MQSDDNQPRDDESSQVEHTNGWFVYICGILLHVSI